MCGHLAVSYTKCVTFDMRLMLKVSMALLLKSYEAHTRLLTKFIASH